MKHQTMLAAAAGLALMMCARPMIGRQDSSGSSLRAEQLRSLNELHENGLLTDDEYRAKLRALRGNGNGAPQGAANAPSYSVAAFIAGNAARRAVEIDDPQFRMRAATLQIPADWRFGGTISRSPGCHGNGAQVQYSTQSPDGMLAVQVYPSFAWRNTGQPSQPRNLSPRLASIRPPQNPCPPLEIESAADFLKHVVLPSLRPWATVTNIEPFGAPGQEVLRQRLEGMRQNAEQQAARYRQMGFPKGQHPDEHMLDGAIAYLHYNLNGQEVEEILQTAVHCMAIWMPGSYVATPSVNVNCNSWPVIVLRAPRGTLMQATRQLVEIKSSIQIDSNWDYQMGELIRQQGQMMNDAMRRNGEILRQESQASQDALTAQHNLDMKQMNDSFASSQARAREQERAMDISAHKTILYALDQNAFIDRRTGTEYDISNQFDHAYLGTDGTVIGSRGPISVTSTVPGIGISEIPMY